MQSNNEMKEYFLTNLCGFIKNCAYLNEKPSMNDFNTKVQCLRLEPGFFQTKPKAKALAKREQQKVFSIALIRHFQRGHHFMSKARHMKLFDDAIEAGVDVARLKGENIQDPRKMHLGYYRDSMNQIANTTLLHLIAATITDPLVDIVEKLNGLGADINARNDDGLTPLHVLAKTRMPAAYKKALLDKFLEYNEIDLRLKMPDGKKACDIIDDPDLKARTIQQETAHRRVKSAAKKPKPNENIKPTTSRGIKR